jgi:hypothetical protein
MVVRRFRTRPAVTAENWPTIKEIVADALERESSDRAAFLDEACSQDAHLRAEVESLLAAYDGAGELSEHPLAIRLLRDAVSHGLSAGNTRGIEKDPDLKSLHGDPRFTALVAEIKKLSAANVPVSK